MRKFLWYSIFIGIVLLAGTKGFGQTKRIPLAGGFVDIPAEYKFESESGADFYVDLIFSGESPSKAPAVLGVYVGDSPGFKPPKSATTRKMKLGNRTVKWYLQTKRENGKTVYNYNALIKLEKNKGFFHLMVSGTDEKEIEKLLAVFGTFRQS